MYETFYLIGEENKSFKAISYVMGNGKDIYSYVNPQYRGQKIIFNSLPYILDDLFKSYKELRISINRGGEFNKQSKKLASAYGFKKWPIENY